MPTRFPPLTRAFASTNALPIAFAAALTVLSSAGLLGATSARAHEFHVGDLTILHPNAPPTPPGVSSAAGYFVVVNEGDEDDRLLGGDASFAGGIEMHRTTIENDVSRMRRLEDGLRIPAGATVRLDPGETHLMFTGLTAALADGERRPATLRFERAGEVEVEFAIERVVGTAATTRSDGMDHDGMDHDGMDHDGMDHDGMDHDGAEREGTDPAER